MDERSETEKMDEIMLPGFRFHPTDEELVGFYLKRKAQQRPLSVELIKQLDIYKYDPWDLPKLASTGEKEWYFYCPRDRKYRNSARPNRVTAAGFWKATGTDRPIYSTEGSRCIGLKKSLVFYRGRAAKGIKTDWMMHEYRLPSLTESAPQKRFMDKNIPANDSWAICRIFKKTNSNAQRAISHSWISPLPETTSEIFNQTEKSSSPTQFSFNNDLQDSCITSFSPLNVPSYTFSSLETSLGPSKPPVDSSPMFFNMSSSSTYGDFGKTSESVDFIGYQDHCNGFSFTIPQEMETEAGAGHGEETALMKDPNGAHFDDQWGTVRSVGTPFSLPDAWKSNFLWDYSPFPTEISPNYFTNKCYT